MDKVQKTAFTDYNAPSSESFRLHSFESSPHFHIAFIRDSFSYIRKKKEEKYLQSWL
jgi:hypothetical protein